MSLALSLETYDHLIELVLILKDESLVLILAYLGFWRRSFVTARSTKVSAIASSLVTFSIDVSTITRSKISQ
jgi:hypothetical protein